MSAAGPSLDLDAVLRLQALTRDYARLSRSGAGLGKVLGGAFLLALAGVDVAGHRSLAPLGAFAPLPAGTVLALGVLPFLWLGAREALGRWWYQRHGAVEPVPQPASPGQERRLQAARIICPALILAGLWPALARPLPLQGLRVALVLALAAGLAAAWPRLLHRGRLERLLGLLLFFGPALLVSGLQMAALDALVAFPLAGAAAVVLGLREHFAYRRVARELQGNA